MKLNFAIILTLFRIAAIPAVVICFYSPLPDARPIAAILFGIAAVTDFIDGWVARKFNQSSRFGEFLDPVADKALLVCVFVTLGFKNVLPLWLIILAVSRDILIVGAVILSWMLEKPVKMKPLWISKLNTAMQIVLIAVALGELPEHVDHGQ